MRYLIDNKDRLDKQLAHISSKRIEYERKGQSDWEVGVMHGEIVNSFRIFIKNLPDDKKGWFSKIDCPDISRKIIDNTSQVLTISRSGAELT